MALVIARSIGGIRFAEAAEPVHACFVLASTDDRRNDHLRALAAIARVVSDDGFLPGWLAAGSGEALIERLMERA